MRDGSGARDRARYTIARVYVGLWEGLTDFVRDRSRMLALSRTYMRGDGRGGATREGEGVC